MNKPTQTQNTKNIILAISGASGAIYAQRLLARLDQANCQTHLIITDTAADILKAELNITATTPSAILNRPTSNLTCHDNTNLASPLASGSTPIDAMVICPCSSHSVAAVATGLANTLLLRAAYVNLKQRRPLILVHRETPLTAIDLENMLKITRAGGTICPAAPPFYHAPKNITDLADALIGRILDLLKIPHNLPIRWTGTPPT